jgi:hypothetical protein
MGGAVALAASFAPGFARAEVPVEEIPASLEAAIEQHIESKGKEYAGFCRVINEMPEIPVGEYCSFVLSIEHNIAEVSYGPVLSDEVTHVSFKHYAGLWTLIDGQEEPEDPTPAPLPSIPPALDSSIKHWVESFGHEYAGLCEVVNARPTIPYGEYCAAVKIEGDIAEVWWGPIASDALTLIRFKNTGGAWAPILPDSPTPTPPPVGNSLPPALNSVIKQFIESRGHVYAGTCEEANAKPEVPFGAYCVAVTIEHGFAEVFYGPVASDDIRMISFEMVNGGWVLEASETPATPTTPAQPAPATPSNSPSPAVPAALEQAIKQLIESKGKKYAGLCVEVNTRPQVPFGEYCAFVNSIKDGVADVSYGPVASDEITRVRFELDGGQWEPLTGTSQPQTGATPRPPSTGSGDGDGGGNGGLVALASIVGVVLLVSSAGAVALRRR